MKEVLVPDIGDFKDVEVIEVLVGPGDAIEKEQSLITLESDKATMEIPSPTSGVVKELKVKVGDKISQGAPILMVEEKGAPTDNPAPQRKEEEREKEQNKPAASALETVTVPD
ncbi:MAG: biotin/lipoyl-containing protein, partial [Burkholderiales bacterium]